MSWRDSDTRITEIQDFLSNFCDEREWGQYHSPRNLVMALSVEVAELQELYLWSRDDGPQPPVAARSGRVAEEAADVFITLLNFCRASGIDLAAATEAKMAKNAIKYPADLARGRLEKSDEL